MVTMQGSGETSMAEHSGAIDASLSVASSSDSEELQRQLLAKMALLVGCMSGLAEWLYLNRGRLTDSGSLTLLFIVAWSAVAWILGRKHPMWTKTLFCVASVASFAWLSVSFPGPSTAFLGVIAVAVGALLSGPGIALLAAILNSVVILLLGRHYQTWQMALVVLWATAFVQWLYIDGLQTALHWSWSNHRRVTELLSELRGHQGDLNRTLRALQEAAERLQRTGHELAEARLRAQEARRAKELFAANISHELRTPLNLIVGFSETMYLYPDLYGEMAWPAPLRGDVYQIYSSAQQLSDLIDDVLDLSRVDARAMPVRRELADLNQVVVEAADSICGLTRGKELSIRTEVPADLPLVPIDRIRIRQVILNLLKNAVRFTDQGEIVVSVLGREEDLVVRVRDTGSGIPEDEMERIFDAFHQVDMALDREEGFGLGLAISRRFVMLHGGHIWVESVVGQGSTFSFSLPLQVERADRPLLVTDAPRPQRPEKPHLVFVSEEATLQDLLSRQLEEYTIHWAPDLNAARDLANKHHPVAVIQNRPLGVEGASDVLRAIQDVLPPRVPCVSCAFPSSEWMARQLGVEACLAKPLRRDVFIEGIGRFAPLQRLLVVDDDHGFYELLLRYLDLERQSGPHAAERLPAEVRWAAEGGEAIEILENWHPDLILLDLSMPGMDGYAFLQRQKAGCDWSDIPVVLVTASQYGDALASQFAAPIVVGRTEGYNTAEVMEKLKALLLVSHPEYPLPLPQRPTRSRAGDGAAAW